LEAEVALRKTEEATDLKIVIIRPPLVYGPGVKGNLRTLVNVLKKGIPLPLALVNNRRDLVSVYNLCDLIKTCVLHPVAPGKTFLVSDNEPISTVQLVRYLAEGLNRRARVFPVPHWLLRIVAGLSGKENSLNKLTENMQVDISQTKSALAWDPPYTVAESFQKMFAEG